MSWKSVRPHIGPLYLLGCLLLGGSGQTIWLNAILQVVAIAILGWAIIEGPVRPISRDARHLVLLSGAVLALVALQVIPLPPVLWEALPGRAMVGQGLGLLSLKTGWQTLSLAPYDTLSTALTLLPPLAMLTLMIVLRAFTRVGLAVALLLGTVLGISLGIFQVSGSEATASRYYLQPEYDGGTASGFFANPDHMATLLLLSLPFLSALLALGLNQASPSRRHAALILGSVGVLLVAVGLVLNGSLAGFGLAIPVLLLSGLMVVKLPDWAAKAALMAAFVAAFSFVALLTTPLSRSLFHGHAAVAISTRQDFFRTGVRVAGDYFPVGSGAGTFARVYRIKENPRTIDPSVFVNHAHDDYLETLIEAGLPGMALAFAFLAWWGFTTVRRIGAPEIDRFALAGAIGAGTIFVHSIVDYPLRTSAMATSMAMCLALMVLPRARARSEQDLRPVRHLEIH